MVTRMSLYRARKNPDKAQSSTLYEVAVKKRTTMEQLLGKTMYLHQIPVDDFVEQDGFIYAYVKTVPLIPPKYGLFVFAIKDKLIVGRRRQIKQYDVIVGIVTLKMQEVPHFGAEI